MQGSWILISRTRLHWEFVQISDLNQNMLQSTESHNGGCLQEKNAKEYFIL